jgi:hypothetical protein
MIQRGTQAPVVVVLERDKPERLQHALRRLAHGTKNLSHTVDRALLSLKGNFDEVTTGKRTRQLQQSSGCGNGLEFSFSVPAIF